MTAGNPDSELKKFIDNLLVDKRNSLQNMATIFVSSTKRDLEEERDAIIYLIRGLGLSVHFMENFGARSEPPLVTCMKELAKSDIYLGILSMNYGSTCEDEHDGHRVIKSYTEKEYDEAVVEKKPILIYMINKKEGRVAPENIDFENHHHLEKFKKRLENNHTVEYFSDTRDLCNKVFRDLCREVEDYSKASNTDRVNSTQQIIQNLAFISKNEIKQSIVITVDKERYHPSDTIIVEGTITSPNSDSVYIYITRPGVTFEKVSQLTDNDLISLRKPNHKFEIAKVGGNNRWRTRINLQSIEWNIKENELCYLIASNKQLATGEDYISSVVQIRLCQPFLVANTSYSICMPNLPLVISGIAETSFPRLYLWIFSRDKFIVRKKILVQKDGSFRYKLSKDILDELDKGEEYFCLLQMPVKFREGDIGVNEDNEIVSINHDSSTNRVSYAPINTTSDNVDILPAIIYSIFDNEKVSDIYVKMSFRYEDTKINWIYARLIEPSLSMIFETNLPVGTKIIYLFKGIRDTRGSKHILADYYNYSSFDGDKNVVTVSKDDTGGNTIKINDDISKFNYKGEYWLSLLTYQTRDELWSGKILSSDGKQILLEE